MKRMISLTLVVILAATAAVWSQAAYSAKEDDVRHLLDLMQTERNMRTVMLDTMNSMRPMMRRAYPSVSDAEWNESIDFATSESKMKKLIDVAVDNWSKHFSHSEIKKIIEFYESSVGRKLIRSQPMMMREMNAALESYANEIAVDLAKQLQRKRREY